MNTPIAKKANGIFYQIIALGAIIFLGVILMGARIYPQFIVIKENLTKKIENACDCVVSTGWSSHPLRSVGVLVVGALVLVFFIYVMTQFIRFLRETAKFVRYNLARKRGEPSFKLEHAVRTLGLSQRVYEITSDSPLVFCYGFLHPRICISSVLVTRLTEKELLAVLSHEQHHLITHEPIKILLVKLLSRGLFFIPWFSLLAKKYFTYAELAADDRATRVLRDKVSLAQALAKILEWGRTPVARDSLTLSFFETVTEERINKLADERYLPRFTIFTFRSVVSTLALAALVFILRPLFATPIIVAAGAQGSCALRATHEITGRSEPCALPIPRTIEPEQKVYSADAIRQLEYLRPVNN